MKLRDLVEEGLGMLPGARLDLELALPALDSYFDHDLQDKALGLSMGNAVYLRRWALDVAAETLDHDLRAMLLPEGARLAKCVVEFPDPDPRRPAKPHILVRLSLDGVESGARAGVIRAVEDTVRTSAERLRDQSFWDRAFDGAGYVRMAAT